MSRWCRICGAKLAARNHKRRTNGYKDRMICQPCFINPSEEDRCTAPTHGGKNRCKHRKKPDSEYCSFHHKRLAT